MIISERGTIFTDEPVKDVLVVTPEDKGFKGFALHRSNPYDFEEMNKWAKKYKLKAYEIHHGRCGLGSVNDSPVWMPKHAQPIVGECTCVDNYPKTRIVV